MERYKYIIQAGGSKSPVQFMLTLKSLIDA